MNMTSKSAQFAALIGIDWASPRHALCLYDCATAKRESSILEHTPEAIAQWARGLQSALRGRKIALCLEQSKGPLIYALLEPAALYSPKLLRICQPVGAPLQLGQALSQGTDGAWQSLSHRHPRPGLQVAAPSCSCAGATASLTMKQSTA